MTRSKWRMVEVVDRAGEVPRERDVTPGSFFRQVLDAVLPTDAVVIRASTGFALDLAEGSRREPFIVDPLPWHQFLAALGRTGS